MAQKAQDFTDAANDLGVDVTNFQNRKEAAIALVAAGWNYFDHYICLLYTSDAADE